MFEFRAIESGSPASKSKMSAEGSSKQGRSAAEIIQQINIKNAKIIAFSMLVGFVVYHSMLHLKFGECNTHLLFITSNPWNCQNNLFSIYSLQG